MENSISQKFNFRKLIMFTIPSIMMLIFTSLYSIVDGVFVSRFVSTDALSAVNIVYPFINIIMGIGVMFASGGSAVIAKKLGEKREEEAKRNFTLIILVGFLVGVFCSIVGFIFSNQIIVSMGATNDLLQYCKDYFMPTLLFVPAFILNLLFQFLTITAGKPKLGLILTIIGGCTNMILDYVFISIFDMGIAGAAYATGIGNLLPSIIGIIYFLQKRSQLYFIKPNLDFKVIIKSCTNGSSEMVTNLATGVTTILFNIIMIRYLGSNGVAAMTIVLYCQFLITALFIGFSMGVSPVISYNYGKDDKKELNKIIKYSLIFICTSSVILFILALIFGANVVAIFSPRGTEVFSIAIKGFLLFSISFLVSGINIFSSALFTSFSDGKTSAIISFLRTFIFIIIGIMLLPKAIGVNGVWLAIPFAEGLSTVVALTFINKYKYKYGYGKFEKAKNIA